MTHKITLIPGDGIGPEVTEAARRCIEATGVSIEWEEVIAGQAALDKGAGLLPESVLDSIRRNKVSLKGPIITRIGEGFLYNPSLLIVFVLYNAASVWDGVGYRF